MYRELFKNSETTSVRKLFSLHTKTAASFRIIKMTETDTTRKPLNMPEKFLPYLEKYRIYKLFKDMARELVVNLPKDHLKHMKVFLGQHLHSSKDVDRVIMLVSPHLDLDVSGIAKEMIKDLGSFVITRRCVIDRYEKVFPHCAYHYTQHDDYVQGCISPILMSEVTRTMTLREPVPQVGWLMFDHPCTVAEARTLQQDGVLPTVTLALVPPPEVAPRAHDPLTPARNFFQQDFEGLKYAYKATLKEVYIEPNDTLDKIGIKCFNAVRACAAGLQGPRHGHHALGAPGTYRVLVLGARGSGRRSQAQQLANHLGLVYLHFDDIMNQARVIKNEIGQKLRNFGTSAQIRAEIVRQRLMQKDCIDNGWVMTGFPTCGTDFEALDTMSTPPNRIVFLNVDIETCKTRLLTDGVDWCTGRPAPINSSPRVMPQPEINVKQLDQELEFFFYEALAELRAAAGLTAVEIDGSEPFDKVQVKIQAAVMAAPAFDIEISSQLHHACGD